MTRSFRSLRVFLFMGKYNVPLSLIKYCVANELLDTLHYYYKLRVAYKNRIIYDFTYKKASNILQISVGAAHNQIKKMIKEGWVTMPHGKLKVKGVNALKKWADELTIPIPIEQTKKAQLLQFRYVLIRQNINWQQHKITKKTEIVNKARTANAILSSKVLRYIASEGGVKKLSESILDRTTLSNKKFGKILSRSKDTGKRYQKAMNEAKLIESKAHYKIMGKIDRSMLNEAKKDYECYYLIFDNGYLKKRMSNSISPLA